MIQAVLIVFMAATLAPFGLIYAYSGAVGGGIAVLGNVLVVRKIFTEYRAQNPGSLLTNCYVAEIQKIIVIAVLFASAIIWIDVLSYATLFGGYLLVQIAPLILIHLKYC
ncbi:MAG: ATP synthase subunit I [Gammaproteobacteria bacterium]